MCRRNVSSVARHVWDTLSVFINVHETEKKKKHYLHKFDKHQQRHVGLVHAVIQINI